MIVFDVDGTLVGGEQVDWKCFDDAFLDAAGFPLTPDFFREIKEVTAQAIVHQALQDRPSEEKKEIEMKTRNGYLKRLRLAHQNNSNVFPAISGAVTLLEEIQNHNIPVAIATGDWFESISLKLNAAGIVIGEIPLVSSSDHYHRSDIIAAAARQAGGQIEDCVYVGDGVWDLRATQQLGIPFIGCGNKQEVLREAGAEHLLDDFHLPDFWNIYDNVSLQNE